MNLVKKKVVWKNSNFFKLWFGALLSTFGDAAYFILLGWFVISITGSEWALGTTLTVATVPRLIFMLLGGVAADKISRKTILVASLSVRALILGSFSIMLFFTHNHAALIYIYLVAVIFGIVDAFFYTASGSILPQIVEKKSLPAANSILQTSEQFSMFMGPLIASALLFLHGYSWIFSIVTTLYIISSISLVFLKINIQTGSVSGTAKKEESKKSSTWTDLKQGIQYVLSTRILTLIMLGSLTANFLFMGPINVAIPVFSKSMQWSGSTYASFEAAFGIGAIVGGLLAGVFKGFRGHLHKFPFIGISLGLTFSLLFFAHAILPFLILMAIMGVLISMVNVPLITYIQTIVDDDKLGRVMSVLSLMSMGLVPISYVITSFILQHKWLSPSSLFLISGVLMVVFWLVMLLNPEFQRIEDHPNWKAVGKSSIAPEEAAN